MAIDAIGTMLNLWQVEEDRIEWVGDASASTIFREGYGFDWWPGDFKVRVRVHGPHPELDFPLYRLSVQTDFLRNVDVTTPKFEKSISDLNRKALNFAICAHPKAVAAALARYGSGESDLDLKCARVWLASTAYIHEDTKHWLPKLFAGLAVLQPIEAQFRADLAMLLLGGEADRSRPPGAASPASVDDILGVDEFIAYHGQQQSKWIDTGEFEQIVERWGGCDSGFGTAGREWLTIETPFGDQTAMLKLKADQPHPRLGNGLFATLTLPWLCESESQTTALSVELNSIEVTRWLKVGAPMIGSWSAETWDFYEKPRFAPAFNFFIPNLMHERGLAENFVLYAMARAKWFREEFHPGAIDLPMHQILDKRLNLR